MSDLDLDAIKTECLELCGCCDAGLPMSCTCPSGDYRPVMLSLVAEVRRLRAERDEAHRTIRSLNDNRELDLAAGDE